MPSSAESKMNNTPKSADSREFFYSERTARIMLVLCAVLAIVYMLAFAFGGIRPVETLLSLFVPMG